MSERVTLVCGGRDFEDVALLCAWLDFLQPTRIVHGACSGADTITDTWARGHGVRTTTMPADWPKFGRKAGPLRNQEMVEHLLYLRSQGNLVGVLAMPGGAGTDDMVTRARRAGLYVSGPLYGVAGT